MPLWNLKQTLVATEARIKWWIILLTVLVFVVSVTMPAFYFALYRNQSALRIPKRLRLLALLAAFIISGFVVIELPNWIRSLSQYGAAISTLDWRAGATTVLIFVQDPRTIGQLSTVFAEFANIAYVLLLIALFRQQSDPPDTEAPTSRLLNRATKAAVIASGLIVFAVLLVLLLTPYTFYTLRKYALQIGRTPPAFLDLFLRQLRTTLQQACLFAAPYIVYRSQRERAATPMNEHPGPELLESDA